MHVCHHLTTSSSRSNSTVVGQLCTVKPHSASGTQARLGREGREWESRLLCVDRRTEAALQVVVGVLGCPNLPQKRIEDADGVAESASKAGTDGVGVIFAAERDQGAFAGPLSGSTLTPDP